MNMVTSSARVWSEADAPGELAQQGVPLLSPWR